VVAHTAGTGEHTSRTLRRLLSTVRAVADADPARIESEVQMLGASRWYLAPVAWAAGALILVLRGLKLLILNWRLTLVELVPALWVWLVTYDLKPHGLRAEPFRHLTVDNAAIAVAISVVASPATVGVNVVFGLAITQPKPRIGLAMRQTRPHLAVVIVAGTAMGLVIAAGLAVISRIDHFLVYLVAAVALYSLMLVALVVVPARALGVPKRRRSPTETMGAWVTGGALSAVAMSPGFILDRIGVVLLGIPGLHLLGLVVLSAGVALYAAGMSSVKAVKLSMKLETADE
jgi:hypothetical protein